MQLPDPPTAIFTTGDRAAIRVLETLNHHGIRVPEEISIIGFDDTPQAAAAYPPLTTVKHPLYEMGEEAVRILLRLIDDPDLSPQHVQLATKLVVRESCAPVPRA